MKFWLSLISILLYHTASAQFEGQTYMSTTNAKVFKNGIERTLAWSGGFNNPQISMADINNDNKPDLVIYERFNKQVKTFVNIGTAGNPDYRYEPWYALNFPTAYEYLILADYNNDGIEDLFDRGLTGFQVYRGYYDSENRLAFTFYKALFYNNDSQSSGSVNAYADPADIPAIYDIDGDGDLDFVGFYAGGSRLYYYRNMRVEDGLPADSIRIKLRDRCWGKAFQDIYRTYNLANSCSNNGLAKQTEGSEHTGNTLCAVDIDGDGDADLLNGNLAFNDIQLLINGKAQSTNGIDSFVSQDTLWQFYNNPTWPAAFNLDIDDDGDKDILITPHADGFSDNYKTIALYRNTGSVNSPVFTFQSDSFLVDKTIDAGTASRPLFYDYDKDGKPDLFVGSDGYFQNGTLRSRISYYRNTSTVGNRSFDFQTDDFVNFSSLMLRGSSPAIGDLDGDGKDDLVLGQANGQLTMYTNTAASNTVQPIWANPAVSIQHTGGFPIDVGQAAAPVIYDIDKDGRPDLLIGNLTGYLVYYRNITTTPGVLQLEFVNSQLGDVKADPNVSYIGYCTPYIGKMDNTGIEYIVTGSESGRIYRFTGFQTGDTTIPYPMIDSAYSWISLVGVRTSPAIADIDGDGMYEMAIGNEYGGLFLFYQWVNASVDNTAAHAAIVDLNVYPNPANDHIDISWNAMVNGEVNVTLLNTAGQKVYSGSVSGRNNTRVDIRELPSGVYFCSVSCGSLRSSRTISVVR